MTGKKKIKRLYADYKALAESLKNTGFILQGTITERIIPSAGKGTKAYGPYYQWTRKIRGKTVTVNLTRTQADKCADAIINNKEFKETAQRMRELSWKICELTTKSVKRRKTTVDGD